MKKFVAGGLVVASFLAAPGVAAARGACPEGRMANGQCANSALAEATRQSAVVYAQPKLSSTHYPVLPSLDRKYRYPNELNPVR